MAVRFQLESSLDADGMIAIGLQDSFTSSRQLKYSWSKYIRTTSKPSLIFLSSPCNLQYGCKRTTKEAALHLQVSSTNCIKIVIWQLRFCKDGMHLYQLAWSSTENLYQYLSQWNLESRALDSYSQFHWYKLPGSNHYCFNINKSFLCTTYITKRRAGIFSLIKTWCINPNLN